MKVLYTGIAIALTGLVISIVGLLIVTLGGSSDGSIISYRGSFVSSAGMLVVAYSLFRRFNLAVPGLFILLSGATASLTAVNYVYVSGGATVGYVVLYTAIALMFIGVVAMLIGAVAALIKAYKSRVRGGFSSPLS